MFFKKKINFEDEVKNVYSLIVQNKTKQAQKSLLRLLKNKDFPSSLDIEVARIYFGLNNLKSAYEYYLKSEQFNINQNDLFNLVEITIALNLSEKCQYYCEKILEFEPNNIKILDTILKNQINNNQLYSALEVIEKMLVLEKNIVDFNKLKFLKANINYDIKQYDNAESSILELLTTDENNTQYLILLSNIYREKNLQSELLTVLNKIYTLTKQIQDSREIATILFNQKDFQRTEEFIINCDETDILLKKILIETNIEQQKYNVALDRINNFLAEDKNNFEFYKLKAQILIKKQQFKSAIDLLENSVDFVDLVYLDEINLLLKNVHIEYSKYLLNKKNFEQAFSVLEDAVKYGTDDDNIYYTIAKCNLEICDYKKAILNLSKAIEINPQNHELYELMSEIYYKHENIEQAISQQFEAVKINPTNLYSLSKLAFLYTRVGDFNLALTYYSKALMVNKNSDEVHYNIALCYHKLGDFLKANEHYKKALELNNNNSSALKNLRILND